MLQLGMILLGTGLILHARHKAKAEDDKDPASPGEDDPAAAAGSKPWEPRLDSAIGADNPWAPPPTNPWGGVIDPDPNFIPGGGVGPGAIGTSVDGEPGPGSYMTAAQLGSAYNVYKALIGSIPAAIKQKIANVKRLTNFQARLRRKLKFW